MFDLVFYKIFYLVIYNWIKIDFMGVILGVVVLCDRILDYSEDVFVLYFLSEVEKVYGKLEKWISNKELKIIYL